MNSVKDIFKEQISQHVVGLKHGYFVTVDSAITTWNRNITVDTLDQFSQRELVQICNAINGYCFGRAFQRREKRLKIVSAIEIGKDTQRLHAHFVMLHEGDCYRTAEHIANRLKTVCKHVLKMSGSNVVDVKPFDSGKDWAEYFVKSTHFMKSRYDQFTNVSVY